MKLSGQTILVTGATGAIGQAICRALVAEGARVVAQYGRNRGAADALLADLGQAARILPADLSDPEAPTALWQAAVAAEGRVTGLVNNAGIRSEVPVNAPLADWQRVWAREMQVNFLAAVDLTRAAILHFRQIGGGRILNMASRAGQRGYASDAMAYGASKAALINLTKSVAQSHGAEGITALALAPGWVRTDLIEPQVAALAVANGGDHEAAAADLLRLKQPSLRFTTPADVGALVCLLASPALHNLTGAAIPLDGGWVAA